MNASFAIPASFDASLATAGLSTPSLSTAGLRASETANAGVVSREAGQSGDDEVRQKFQEILGELMFGQMLKSMRRTVDKPAYFHGGRAEEVFTQQLDQMLAQKISQSSGEQFFGPMYELWATGRK